MSARSIGPPRGGYGSRSGSSSRGHSGQASMRPQGRYSDADFRSRPDRGPNNNNQRPSDYGSSSDHGGMRSGDQGPLHANNQHRDTSREEYSLHRGTLDHSESRDYGGGPGGSRDHGGHREHLQNSRGDAPRMAESYYRGAGDHGAPRNGGTQHMELPPPRLDQHHIAGSGLPSASGGLVPQEQFYHMPVRSMSMHEMPPPLDIHSSHMQQHLVPPMRPPLPPFSAMIGLTSSFPPGTNLGGVSNLRGGLNGGLIHAPPYMPPTMPVRGQHTVHLNTTPDRSGFRGNSVYGGPIGGPLPPPPLLRGPPPQVVRNNYDQPPPSHPPPFHPPLPSTPAPMAVPPSSSLQMAPEDVSSSYSAAVVPLSSNVSISRDVTPPTFTPPPPPYNEPELVKCVREVFEEVQSHQFEGQYYYYADKGEEKQLVVDPNFKPVDLEEFRAKTPAKRHP